MTSRNQIFPTRRTGRVCYMETEVCKWHVPDTQECWVGRGSWQRMRWGPSRTFMHPRGVNRTARSTRSSSMRTPTSRGRRWRSSMTTCPASTPTATRRRCRQCVCRAARKYTGVWGPESSSARSSLVTMSLSSETSDFPLENGHKSSAACGFQRLHPGLQVDSPLPPDRESSAAASALRGRECRVRVRVRWVKAERWE